MKIDGKHYLTIWHNSNDDTVHIIDQTKLPFKFEIKKLETFQDGYNAIKDMLVRGAPLIGATAAYSLYLASKQNEDFTFIQNKVSEIKTARPTAVNLSGLLRKSTTSVNSNFAPATPATSEKVT